MKVRTETFELMPDNKVITVKATPFQTLTGETRYRVSINDSPVHIFAPNESLKRFTDIETGAAGKQIPINIETAIGEQLYQRTAA
ncbi:hypothetical protein ACI6Q2_21105 [Chitinophagaceae bacterium LWZ2-11]